MNTFKDIKIPWVSDLPEEWEISRIKNEFIITKNLVGDKSKDFDLLSLTLN
jgi:type I restriction enzyme, S subunit